MLTEKRVLSGLTGARFFAAALVVITHCAPFIAALSLLWPLTTLAGPAVSFFFVLSGFVLTYNYADWFRGNITASRVKEFLMARFARIYPMYFVAVAISVPVTLFSLSRFAEPAPHPEWPGTPIAILSWIVDACLLQGYLPSHAIQGLWNGPGWSVACEAFFYLCFPFVTLILAKLLVPDRGRPWLRGALLLLLLLLVEYLTVALLPIAVMKLFHGPRGEAMANTAIYYWPPARLAEFIIGCTAGHLFLTYGTIPVLGNRYVRDVASIVLIIAILAVAWFLPEARSGRFAFFSLYTPLAIALILVLVSGRSMATAVLDSSLCVLLGESSYSLYLIHWPAVQMICALSGLTWGWRETIILFGATPLMAIGTFYYIERPARRWLRRSPAGSFKLQGVS